MHSALIIDADGKTPATLKNILAPYGFEFTITENGPEAVNVARQAAPDIIFLRAELPLTSGFSVCNRLRRHEDTKRIPLIMYSSNVSDDVFEQHRNLKTHADDYLRLPLDESRLVAAIRPVLPIGEAKPDNAPGAGPARPAGQAGPLRPVEERLEVELRDAPRAPATTARPSSRSSRTASARSRTSLRRPSRARARAPCRRPTARCPTPPWPSAASRPSARCCS
ncbi:response regulator [Nannocystis pusilla]|uniref:response regulator n=1 Tax=Nannocystis pusilla TaxID=889268 RepID=UPI003B7B3D18